MTAMAGLAPLTAWEQALLIGAASHGAGLPIGMQIAARPVGERTVPRVPHTYQRVTDWHEGRRSCWAAPSNSFLWYSGHFP